MYNPHEANIYNHVWCYTIEWRIDHTDMQTLSLLWFLPIDVSCLHITQTVRLWTTQKEKVRLWGMKTDRRLSVKLSWIQLLLQSLYLKPFKIQLLHAEKFHSIHELILQSTMIVQTLCCLQNNFDLLMCCRVVCGVSHRDDLVLVDTQYVSHTQVLPLRPAETDTEQPNRKHI